MNRNVLFVFLIGVVVIAISFFLVKSYEYFTSAPLTCVFKTLGTYKLSTSQSAVQSSTAKGLIYISDLTSWSKITYKKPSDDTYSYTDFSPLDLAGVNIKSIINKVMICNRVPEFSGTVGVNTAAALILCLQSNTTPGSRVFFVKCFVPRASLSDSNAIIGEIGGNTIATYHGDVKPVAVIQGGVGLPNTTDTYTLSYTICSASSRPAGFAYSDCCKSILDTAPVISIPMTSADITKTDGTQCTDPVTTVTPGPTDTRYSGLGDPTCAKGKYSVVTGGACTGTVDTDAYKLAVRSSIPSDSGTRWYLGGSDDESGLWRRLTRDSSGNVHRDEDEEDDDGYAKWYHDKSKEWRKKHDKDRKDDDDDSKSPNEFSWHQRHHREKSDPKAKLKPGFSDCQKYYNCKKDYEEDEGENDYEGEC